MDNTRRIKDLLYEQVARIGKAAGSPKRLELIELLCQGEKTVETLAREAAISMKLASAHLRELRAAHLVERICRQWWGGLIYRDGDAGTVARSPQCRHQHDAQHCRDGMTKGIEARRGETRNEARCAAR